MLSHGPGSESYHDGHIEDKIVSVLNHGTGSESYHDGHSKDKYNRCLVMVPGLNLIMMVILKTR